MFINTAEIVISAVRPEQYPEDHLPEVVLLGRSNVGKSSFINAMIDRRDLARTSSQPGKTQTINFYRLNERFYFVDMPGYGYAKVSKKERERFGKMIETYLLTREHLKMVLLLVDSRHPPTEDDVLMYRWLEYYQIKPLVIASKSDKLSKNQLSRSMKTLKDTLDLDEDGYIFFSATTKKGKEKIWQKIEHQLQL
ncbi:MAG: YihA family ribosome biogenesis GTP-binding protein [Eubacteriaceae bacterium]|jgi:GTP-binding protein|nr:YihA family ribosome biogenesis GTP-binding protein [Eubacteriaceae bacterium]